jgi:hypothetical protein
MKEVRQQNRIIKSKLFFCCFYFVHCSDPMALVYHNDILLFYFMCYMCNTISWIGSGICWKLVFWSAFLSLKIREDSLYDLATSGKNYCRWYLHRPQLTQSTVLESNIQFIDRI